MRHLLLAALIFFPFVAGATESHKVLGRRIGAFQTCWDIWGYRRTIADGSCGNSGMVLANPQKVEKPDECHLASVPEVTWQHKNEFKIFIQCTRNSASGRLYTSGFVYCDLNGAPAFRNFEGSVRTQYIDSLKQIDLRRCIDKGEVNFPLASNIQTEDSTSSPSN